jgi:hypothetical protein
MTRVTVLSAGTFSKRSSPGSTEYQRGQNRDDPDRDQQFDDGEGGKPLIGRF